MEFQAFPKIPRLFKEVVVTEKIDGTNALIAISDDGKDIKAGSRKRWITPEDDNYGFAKWVEDNREDLLTLGPGYHYGEWWGRGIQRGYGLDHRRFSLFNITRWLEDRPKCCDVVPLLWQGSYDELNVRDHLDNLLRGGSLAQIGYMNPEGIIIYHTAAGNLFKVTL